MVHYTDEIPRGVVLEVDGCVYIGVEKNNESGPLRQSVNRRSSQRGLQHQRARKQT